MHSTNKNARVPQMNARLPLTRISTIFGSGLLLDHFKVFCDPALVFDKKFARFQFAHRWQADAKPKFMDEHL